MNVPDPPLPPDDPNNKQTCFDAWRPAIKKKKLFAEEILNNPCPILACNSLQFHRAVDGHDHDNNDLTDHEHYSQSSKTDKGVGTSD